MVVNTRAGSLKMGPNKILPETRKKKALPKPSARVHGDYRLHSIQARKLALNILFSSPSGKILSRLVSSEPTHAPQK